MKTTANNPITPQQLKALHATFHNTGMDDEARHACIYSFTGGRTQSSKGLTMTEARLLLEKLNLQDEKMQKMIQAEKRTLFRSIYFLSTQITFLNKGFSSETEEDRKMNIAKLNVWARGYSKPRRNINAMNVNELREVKKQLEAIARKENDFEK